MSFISGYPSRWVYWQKSRSRWENWRWLKKQLSGRYEAALPVLRVCNFVAEQTVLEGVRLWLDAESSADHSSPSEEDFEPGSGSAIGDGCCSGSAYRS